MDDILDSILNTIPKAPEPPKAPPAEQQEEKKHHHDYCPEFLKEYGKH